MNRLSGTTRIFALCVVALLAPLSGRARSADATKLEQDFAKNAIVIEASGTACYDFDVFLAITGTQQRRGLMNVKKLPEFTGMLFVYTQDDYHSMWMKNTYIPLDMVFIRSDGTIAWIARDTEPLSLRSISPEEPVQYVLELNGGVTEALQIEPGSRVLLPGDLSLSQ